MRHFLSLILLIVISNFIMAQSNDEKSVLSNVERFRLAMISADENALNVLTAEKLSFGHSNGLIEDQKEFIRKITSRENVYLKLDHSKESIVISGKSAIVRLQFEAETMADGKPGASKLHVLMVWQKQGREWKLLARQAIKIIS